MKPSPQHPPARPKEERLWLRLSLPAGLRRPGFPSLADHKSTMESLPHTIMKPTLRTFMYFIRNLESIILMSIMHFLQRYSGPSKCSGGKCCHGLKSTWQMPLIRSWRFAARISRFEARGEASVNGCIYLWGGQCIAGRKLSNFNSGCFKLGRRWE